MKYLACFRPNKDLSDLIFKQNHLVLPSSGLHSTLCVFYMKPENELNLITDLSKIYFNPFEIETLEFGDFYKDSLVLKLSCSDRLLQLHKKIVSVVKCYSFKDLEEFYEVGKYNPHFRISKSSKLEFDRTSKELIGKRDIIQKYILVRKDNGSAKEIKDFYFTE